MTRPDIQPAQIPLPFPHRPDFGRETYFVSPANRAALHLVDRWPHWPSHAAAISAPIGGGKTHLVHIWLDHTQGRPIDGADLEISHAAALPERFCVAIDNAHIAAFKSGGAEALFHLMNRAQQEGGFVLLTGDTHPSQWRTDLPDLKTRLAAVTLAEVSQPDDTLMAAILTKLLNDFQLSASPGLVSFIVARIERNFAAVCNLARAMDLATIGTGRMLSYELVDRLIKADARD